MPVLALALYLLWLAVCLGLRMALHQRRTGSTGFVMQVPRRPVEWWSGLAFASAVVLGLLAPVAQMVGLDPVGELDHGAVAGLGIMLALVGIALTFVAQMEMGASWRVGVDPAERTTLVRTGLFRFVRNPIFTAMGATSWASRSSSRTRSPSAPSCSWWLGWSYRSGWWRSPTCGPPRAGPTSPTPARSVASCPGSAACAAT